MTLRTLGLAAGLLLAVAGPAAAQAVYHVENDPRASFYDWHKKSADKGNSHVESVTGLSDQLLDEDLTVHSFTWKDGYVTRDGQPTYSVQMALRRQPRTFTRIPVLGVSDNVYLARNNRRPEWTVPMTGATFYIYPERGNPNTDTPLAVVGSKNADEGFRVRATNLTWQRYLVKAVVEHTGLQGDKRVEFQRTYTFRPPTVELEDGRHEPYELYHWFH